MITLSDPQGRPVLRVSPEGKVWLSSNLRAEPAAWEAYKALQHLVGQNPSFCLRVQAWLARFRRPR